MKDLKKYEVKNCSLIIHHNNQNKTVNFPFSILKILEFDKCLVIMLDFGEVKFSENVFCVSFDGEILWQIRQQKYLDKISPYTGISRVGDLLTAYNWSGMRYWLNPETGDVIKEEYVK